MALPQTIEDREWLKFFSRDGKWHVRTGDDHTGSSLDTVVTTINTSPTRISTPEGSRDFLFMHRSENVTIYIGDSAVSVDENLDLEVGDVLEVTSMGANDSNELYGIVSSGTAKIYVTGIIK